MSLGLMSLGLMSLGLMSLGLMSLGLMYTYSAILFLNVNANLCRIDIKARFLQNR